MVSCPLAINGSWLNLFQTLLKSEVATRPARILAGSPVDFPKGRIDWGFEKYKLPTPLAAGVLSNLVAFNLAQANCLSPGLVAQIGVNVQLVVTL